MTSFSADFGRIGGRPVNLPVKDYQKDTDPGPYDPTRFYGRV